MAQNNDDYYQIKHIDINYIKHVLVIGILPTNWCENIIIDNLLNNRNDHKLINTNKTIHGLFNKNDMLIHQIIHFL